MNIKALRPRQQKFNPQTESRTMNNLTAWELIERVTFLLCLIVAACDVLWWRP